MGITHIDMDGQMGCGIAVTPVRRLDAVTLAEYEKDYPEIATSRWRQVCLKCDRKAAKLTGLPVMADLTCPFCDHAIAEHSNYGDGRGRFALCRSCPNRITERYGDADIYFTVVIYPVCLHRRIRPDEDDMPHPSLDATLDRLGLDRGDLLHSLVSYTMCSRKRAKRRGSAIHVSARTY